VLAKQGEKKVQVVASAGNPYTQGLVAADTAFKVGDTYGYIVMNRESRAEINKINSVCTGINENEVIFGDGALILDRLGNTVKLPNGNRFTPRQDQPTEYAIGKKWSTRFGVVSASGRTGESEFEFRITKREKVTVPAGTFDCYVLEGEGYTILSIGKVELKLTRWMAPDRVRRPIAVEQYRKFMRDLISRDGGFGRKGGGKGPRGPQNIDQRQELAFYKQS